MIGMTINIDRDRTINLSGNIVENTSFEIIFQIDKFIREDNALPIFIIINSRGGDVYSGLAIIDKIKDSPVPIITHIQGRAMSMAAEIAYSGTYRTATQNSFTLLHYPNSNGDHQFSEKVKETTLSSYTKTILEAANKDEILFHGKELKGLGLIHEITSDPYKSF
jgi:hypothetical protein